MWKFIFYPQWDYEAIEKKLAKMERIGYRLTKVRCFWFFAFEKCKPKEVKYIFTYNFPREHPMLEIECELRSKYNANQIDGGEWLYTSIYRVTQIDYDLSSIKEFRRKYLKKVFIEKISLGIMFAIMSLVGISLSSEPIFFSTESIILCVLELVSTLYILWYVGGLIILIYRSEQSN